MALPMEKSVKTNGFTMIVATPLRTEWPSLSQPKLISQAFFVIIAPG